MPKLLKILIFCLMFLNYNFIYGDDLLNNYDTKLFNNIPEEKELKADNFIFFITTGLNNFTNNKNKLNILLQTKSNATIYKSSLIFFTEKDNFKKNLTYISEQKPLKKYDEWFKEDKEYFINNNVFSIELDKNINNIFIEFEACIANKCFLPTIYSLELLSGAKAQLKKNIKKISIDNFDNIPIVPTIQSINNIDSTLQQTNNRLQNNNISIDERLANLIKTGGFWLIPALLIGGILMNLTPCVYPMIPITFGILSNLSADTKTNSRRQKIQIFSLYILGMALSFSSMGIFVALSGNIFGAILQNIWFSLFLSIIFILLALTMLSVFDISFLQNIGTKIQVKNKPKLNALSMGALSGIISAPCTGPILATLLSIVSTTKDFVFGFITMFFLAIGFGLPYLILAFLWQKPKKLPKLGNFAELIKIIFAGLIFSLSIYYARILFYKISFTHFIYYKPDIIIFSLVLFIAIVSSFLFLKNKFLIISKLFSIISFSILSLWLCLYLVTGFTNNNKHSNIIVWETNINSAFAKASKEHKKIIVDIWADWCTSCREMDSSTWIDNDVQNIIYNNYVPLKLDYDRDNLLVKELSITWDFSGLPVVAIINANNEIKNKPLYIFRRKVDPIDIIKIHQ